MQRPKKNLPQLSEDGFLATEADGNGTDGECPRSVLTKFEAIAKPRRVSAPAGYTRPLFKPDVRISRIRLPV